MLITNLNKVVLHMPRCAGSSIRWAIMRTGTQYKYSCEHADIKSIPKQFKDLERVAFTRHPISWYESWYNYTKMRFNSKRLTTNSVWVFILSNGFTENIDTFIDNALNLKRFLANDGIEKLKERIKHVMMNHYLCRYASYWEDISSLEPDMFDGSLYDWYVKTIGIDTATLFRMETQLMEGLKYICPTAKLQKQNECKVKNECNEHSKVMIADTEYKYFKQFGYWS